MSGRRYWRNALIGVALSSAAVGLVAWATYSLTRLSICTPKSIGDRCTDEATQLVVAIVVAIVALIPLGSIFFARRTSPASSSLGPLALGLGLSAAGGAALWSALGTAAGTSAELPGFVAAGVLLTIGPIFLLTGLATAFSSGRPAAARSVTPQPAAPGGASLSTGGSPSPPAGPSAASQFGTLAAQLAAIAAARAPPDGEDTADDLRQLEELRNGGLLSDEQYATRRRAILGAP